MVWVHTTWRLVAINKSVGKNYTDSHHLQLTVSVWYVRVCWTAVGVVQLMYKRLDGKMCDWGEKWPNNSNNTYVHNILSSKSSLVWGLTIPKQPSRRFRFSPIYKNQTLETHVHAGRSNEYKEVVLNARLVLAPLSVQPRTHINICLKSSAAWKCRIHHQNTNTYPSKRCKFHVLLNYHSVSHKLKRLDEQKNICLNSLVTYKKKVIFWCLWLKTKKWALF